MNEATRRQVLADLGIDVWRLRDSTVPEPAAQPVSRPVAVDPVAAPGPVVAPVRARPASPPRSLAQPVLSLQSIAVPGLLLLVGGTLGRRDRRLVLDLLGAATGDWDLKPAVRQFQWPPALPAGAADAAAQDVPAERALRAFIDKDIGDHAVSVLICTADVAAVLPGPDAWPGCRRHRIDSLSALGQDPAGKRALWRFLSEAGR